MLTDASRTSLPSGLRCSPLSNDNDEDFDVREYLKNKLDTNDEEVINIKSKIQ